MNAAHYDGFILQSTYRIHQRVPVVYLFGRLVDGRTFVVRDTRQRPHFYVAAEDAKAVANAHVHTSSRSTFDGKPVVEVEVAVPADAPGVRDALHAQGVTTYEADVRFATRYLIDRGIRGGVRIYGKPRQAASRQHQDRQLLFENPELEPAEVMIQPRILSFDIETKGRADELLAIAVFAPPSEQQAGMDAVVVVDPQGRVMPDKAHGVFSERDALAWFASLVRQYDPDVITGWNVIDFDLSVLSRIAARCGYDLQLGRERGALRIRPAEGYFGSGQASIPGRLVLDGMDLLRGAFVKMDDYSLDAVAASVLGEGKTLGGEGRDKVSEILHSYAEDLPSFTLYARTDARLALQIAERLDLVRLAFARSALTGMQPDRVAASIASFDFLYLSALRPRRLVAPSVQSVGQRGAMQAGGAVFEPKVGIHQNVWVCDFKSLYPSIIRTFNIDPLGYVRGRHAKDAIRTHEGTAFARGESILPRMLDDLFPQRARAKANGDEVASQAIKILMNSFYGVLGTSACRFYNPAIANAITGEGRYLLNWSRQWFEGRGYTVLYGDTDSVFVASGMVDAQAAHERAGELVAEFNQALNQHIHDSAGVTSRLELEFEKLYTQLFLASVRGGSQGARKRYAGQRFGGDEVEFVGMEVVRRDWTELAKQVQRSLFNRLFTGDEVADYLRDTVAALRQGELDDLLVYRKGLRKSVDTYTSNVPPHVQAVKKSAAPAPRVVAYVITTAGPELSDEVRHPLDREHYVEKQIRPVATPVLEALGLDFNQVIGDDRQIALF